MPIRPIPLGIPSDPAERLLLLLVGAAALTALAVAVTLPLSDGFDERAHYAYVRAMAEAATLFPDHSALRFLDAGARAWTGEPNYLAHPSLYYLLAAPVSALSPGHPLPVRLLDIGLALTGFVLAGLGGLARLHDPTARLLYVVVLFGLPHTIGVAGLVNNDDLMIALMGGIVFCLGRRSTAPWTVALLLAALGWTKFTGFVAASLLTGIALLVDRDEWSPRRAVILATGILVGSVPVLHTLATIGRPIWVPAAFPDWFATVPAALRPSIDILDFADLYLDNLGRRLPFEAGAFDATPVLVTIFVAAALALHPVAADRHGRRGPIVAALVVGLFVALHFAYAWTSFLARGSLADLQPRYLGAVWPLVAFAVATGTAILPRRLRLATTAAILAGVLSVSVIGAAILTIAQATRGA